MPFSITNINAVGIATALNGRGANSKLAESLYCRAIGDGPQSVTAAIFWLKTRAKWRETNINEINGPDGASPINEIVVRFVCRLETT